MLNRGVGVQGAVLVAQLLRRRECGPQGAFPGGYYLLAGGAQGFIHLLTEPFQHDTRNGGNRQQQRHDKCECPE